MSAWLDHVKRTMKLNPSKSFKEVLKMAKKTYKKGASTVKYAITGKKATRKNKSKRGKTSKKSKATRGKKAKRGKTSKRSKSSKKGGGDKFDVNQPLSVDDVRQGINAATGQTIFSDRQLANVTGFNDTKKRK